MAKHRAELSGAASKAVALVRETRLRVFVAAAEQAGQASLSTGNRAAIICCTGEPSAQAMQVAATEAGLPASCFVWPGADDAFGIRCFSPTAPILCCGHGLLAAAHVLQTTTDSPEPLELKPTSSQQSIKMFRRGGMPWILLPRLACEACEVPAWTRRAFSAPPQAAAVAGGEAGYLVLEFPREVDLQRMTVKHEQIIANSRRAVIVTQWSKSTRRVCAGGAETHFLLRYFAPQYGVSEDAVTGSASRVLADYWHGCKGVEAFRAWQCSATGGEVHTAVCDEGIAVGGHVVVAGEL